MRWLRTAAALGVAVLLGGCGGSSPEDAVSRFLERQSVRGSAPPRARPHTRGLMVRRDEAWYVATPQSFNPLLARGGGPSGAALRRAHRKLVAAASG